MSDETEESTMESRYFWRDGFWTPAPNDAERCEAVTDIITVPLDFSCRDTCMDDPDLYRCRLWRGHAGEHAAPGITWLETRG